MRADALPWRPIQSALPRLSSVVVEWHGHSFELPYLYRQGPGPAIMFLHGLGGIKENFSGAFHNHDLADCTLLTVDLPGSGLATFDPTVGLDVSGLADLTHLVAARLLPQPYVLVGASMGGLITLLQIRRHGLNGIRGLVNIEGNLLSEDCMFSRRAVPHSLETFADRVFEGIINELRASTYLGDRLLAQNMTSNVDVRAFHAYSFETVRESDSGGLLDMFLQLSVPRLFLYGDANRHLSYLERLRRSDVQVEEIEQSAHLLYYDNPIATYHSISKFVYRVAG